MAVAERGTVGSGLPVNLAKRWHGAWGFRARMLKAGRCGLARKLLGFWGCGGFTMGALTIRTGFEAKLY